MTTACAVCGQEHDPADHTLADRWILKIGPDVPPAGTLRDALLAWLVQSATVDGASLDEGPHPTWQDGSHIAISDCPEGDQALPVPHLFLSARNADGEFGLGAMTRYRTQTP